MIQNHAYLIRRNGIFYFSRRLPADVRSQFNKERMIISLRTRSLQARPVSQCLVSASRWPCNRVKTTACISCIRPPKRSTHSSRSVPLGTDVYALDQQRHDESDRSVIRTSTSHIVAVIHL